jgi:hypothetical protein
MVSKRTFINNILEIQSRAPTYRTRGVGADGTCDCIGLIMGAMYEAGHKKYDMHSSNYFARYQMEELYPVSRAEHLFTGMIVYKAREDTSQLHERYQLGGRYYTGDMLDYYHVGVVLTPNPLEIIHCTSGDGVDGITIDSTMGKWAFGGRLVGVDYSNDGIDTVEEEKPMEPYTAKVTAPSGSTVNMRMRPDESAAVVVRVPIGSTVDVQTQADGWARIVWNGTVGYMMEKFLSRVADDAEAGTNEEFVTISLPLPVARIVMQALQEVLG